MCYPYMFVAGGYSIFTQEMHRNNHQPGDFGDKKVAFFWGKDHISQPHRHQLESKIFRTSTVWWEMDFHRFLESDSIEFLNPSGSKCELKT